MTAITFLCSGGGGNLRLIHSLARRGALPGVSLAAVVADRECGALQWARAQGIAARLVPYSRAEPGPMREALADLDADLIITTIHKILDEGLVRRYEDRLINLHYSLLPAFAGAIGMEPVRLAMEKGCRLVGATAHRVIAQVDAGPILAQACIAPRPDMPDDALHDAIFRCGAVALMAAIDGLVAPATQQPGAMLQAGEVGIFAGPRPRADVCERFTHPAFWEALR